MARVSIARLKKLEARRAKPSVVRGSVARFTPDGRLLGPVPNGACMAVTDHGTDAQWQIALMKQQTQLILLSQKRVRWGDSAISGMC